MQIAIADDHLLIFSAIETAIATTGYMSICSQFTTGEALINGLKEISPDVLLLDYHLPDQNGASLARYITYHYPAIKIIALTGFDKPGLAKEMMENGCMGYLLKTSANIKTIVEAIERVSDGYMFVDSSVREQYAASIQKDKETTPRLTNREIEILRELANGLSSQEIAEKLYISKSTVDNHRNSIMVKSGAKNIASLIRYAIELKLI